MADIDDSDPNRVQKRAAWFTHGINIVTESFPEVLQENYVEPAAPNILSQAYFLINDAYKSRRMPSHSLTNTHKRAGLSASAVMTIRPFIPLNPDEMSTEAGLFANTTLAMLLAISWLGNKNLYNEIDQDYQLRFHNILMHHNISALSNFIDLVNSNEEYSAIEAIEISPSDSAALDDLVTKFYMLDRRPPTQS